MALIDVSDVVNDPDFTDTFILIRNAQTVDPNSGRAVNASPATGIPVTGIIQSASGRTLELYPEASRTSGAIEIWTTTPLQMGQEGVAADSVIWNNNVYIVYHVDDWTNYGLGYVHAVCILLDLRAL